MESPYIAESQKKRKWTEGKLNVYGGMCMCDLVYI